MNPPHRRHCCCCRRRCPHPAMTSTVGRGTAAALRASSSMAAPRSSGRPCGPVALPPAGAPARPCRTAGSPGHNSEQRTAGSTTMCTVPAGQQQRSSGALVTCAFPFPACIVLCLLACCGFCRVRQVSAQPPQRQTGSTTHRSTAGRPYTPLSAAC
eukprot:COSAG01_NODE_567_length_15336_cov_341.292689_2_plen_156_part_00